MDWCNWALGRILPLCWLVNIRINSKIDAKLKKKKNVAITRTYLVLFSISLLHYMPVSRGPGSYNPSMVPGNVCNMFLWDRVLCGVSYVCNFGLTWGTIHKSGLFRFTFRSCQTARSFLLPSSHYRVGTAPLMSGLVSAAGQESHRSDFILVGWVVVGGMSGRKRVQCNLRQKNKIN